MGILKVCTPDELPGQLALDVPGAFAWWYCDLVDERGDGIVLIWFFGLPFLPGYQAERGVPREHPGLNLAVYRGGKPSFYLLQEHEIADVEFAPEAWRWRFGASSIALEWQGADVWLRGHLELQVPGTDVPCRVDVDVRGPRSRVAPQPGDERHAWCPIAPTAEGCVAVDEGTAERWTTSGRAYVDANTSRSSFMEMGVEAWHWGRIAFPERELVYFAMQSTSAAPELPTVLSIPRGMPAERSDEPRLTWSERRRGRFGLDWFTRGTVHDPQGRRVELSLAHRVEDGPFYLRFLVEAHCPATGERGRGVAELVQVTRIDRAWQRPFVRMRRHLAHGSNSMWLPLFSGPRRGRVARLVRHWIGGTNRGTEP